MLYNRKFDWWLLLIVPTALIVYVSTRPHIRLRADMPPQFVDIPASAGPEQREAEEQLARQYWNCALTVIQWKYTYGASLPDSPPEEFRVKTQEAPGSEAVSSSRVRYWHRLQLVWHLPSSWATSQEWSTNWLTEPIKKGVAWINNYIRDLFARGWQSRLTGGGTTLAMEYNVGTGRDARSSHETGG